MSVVEKTRRTRRTSSGKLYRFVFKRSTPRRILADAKRRYAAYLNIVDDESVPITETEWYRRMSKEMTPARYLKTYRETFGYSQAKLGELIGTPASRISDFETGQRAISRKNAKKLAALFNVTPGVFV
jgi:antitoxin component HigA of HigAB toxin-antitoxin module